MAIAKDPKVIMNEKQFVERLVAIKNRKTFYKNKYPYNLCYINKDGRTSADCVNLVKAILNGYNIYNNAIGYFQKDLSNTGDCTEAELICQCDDVSGDFSALSNQARILYMKGHIGTYIGKTVEDKYNVIECTTSFGGGVVYSWVDSDGTRRKEKGGVKNGKWMKHGLPNKWVEYASESPTSNESKKDYEVIAREIIDGKWGNGDDRKARLRKAGYTDEEIKEIQSIVNDMCKQPSKEVWYTVKPGDTLGAICRKYNVSQKSVLALNPSIKNPNIIRVGQKIRIK